MDQCKRCQSLVINSYNNNYKSNPTAWHNTMLLHAFRSPILLPILQITGSFYDWLEVKKSFFSFTIYGRFAEENGNSSIVPAKYLKVDSSMTIFSGFSIHSNSFFSTSNREQNHDFVFMISSQINYYVSST